MNEQQRLLDVIWNSNAQLLTESGFDARGISIYRKNLFANAQRALSITFPTLFELLDSDVSDNIVAEFLELTPPAQGDWALWGEGFSDFIATTQIAEDYAYLPDCAKLDWHVHGALHGKDQTVDQASLLLLSSSSPEKLTVEFNQNVTFIKTKFPLVDIYQAHHHDDVKQREIAIKQTQHALLNTQKEHVVMVFRPEFKPQVITLNKSESEFYLHLKAGKTLAESFEHVNSYHDFSFEKWLIKAIEQNLIYHFKEK